MADCLSQRKTKTLKISTHHEVKVLLLKNWIDDLKKKNLVFDCEQFSCYPTENTWHQDTGWESDFYFKKQIKSKVGLNQITSPLISEGNWSKHSILLSFLLNRATTGNQTYTLHIAPELEFGAL